MFQSFISTGSPDSFHDAVFVGSIENLSPVFRKRCVLMNDKVCFIMQNGSELTGSSTAKTHKMD